jgi:hypothetical protein
LYGARDQIRTGIPFDAKGVSYSSLADRSRLRVMRQNSVDRLSGPPFVVVEDPAQPFMADDGGIHVDHARRFLDQPIVEPLMIPLDVVVLRVFLHRVA